jgi:hypothetical protein
MQSRPVGSEIDTHQLPVQADVENLQAIAAPAWSPSSLDRDLPARSLPFRRADENLSPAGLIVCDYRRTNGKRSAAVCASGSSRVRRHDPDGGILGRPTMARPARGKDLCFHPTLKPSACSDRLRAHEMSRDFPSALNPRTVASDATNPANDPCRNRRSLSALAPLRHPGPVLDQLNTFKAAGDGIESDQQASIGGDVEGDHLVVPLS